MEGYFIICNVAANLISFIVTFLLCYMYFYGFLIFTVFSFVMFMVCYNIMTADVYGNHKVLLLKVLFFPFLRPYIEHHFFSMDKLTVFNNLFKIQIRVRAYNNLEWATFFFSVFIATIAPYGITESTEYKAQLVDRIK
ncbi:hypothetical protein BD770DRAFT_405729 [Pilaira anomala]|nr:hypothetical protein BD770DRAFT_405729 [Pilaira anomala]